MVREPLFIAKAVERVIMRMPRAVFRGTHKPIKTRSLWARRAEERHLAAPASPAPDQSGRGDRDSLLTERVRNRRLRGEPKDSAFHPRKTEVRPSVAQGCLIITWGIFFVYEMFCAHRAKVATKSSWSIWEAQPWANGFTTWFDMLYHLCDYGILFEMFQFVIIVHGGGWFPTRI